MARVLNKDEYHHAKERILRQLKECLFIYPTDTIYGIGCNAMDARLVHEVRRVKQRHDLPFSVIAPSKEWIREYCQVDERCEEWLDKLPGPYTLVLKLKTDVTIPLGVNLGAETLGVRIPDHWFASVISELGVPVITTSANRTGEDYMTSIEDLHPDIKRNVNWIFYEGEITGRPSTIVRLDLEEATINER